MAKFLILNIPDSEMAAFEASLPKGAIIYEEEFSYAEAKAELDFYLSEIKRITDKWQQNKDETD